jgi:beta-lactamase class C
MSTFARRLVNAFIAFCFLPSVCCAANTAAQIRANIDSVIPPVMAAFDVPGMAVAVTVNGRPYFFNYGVASKRSGTPVSETTLFEIGSISKTFTATLAAYAQVRGKLSLQDHPGKYLPQLKGSAIDMVSLIHLGTYTAGGLPLQFPDEVSNDQMMDYFRQWKPDAPAGTLREYSNPSIGLLGHITALALKMEFESAMQGTLFPKLGLNHSYIRVPDGEMAGYAWGTNKANEPVRVNPGVLDAQAYGVKSTAADMIHFVQTNIDRRRLDPAMQRAVADTHTGFFKIGDMVQGLGWEQYPYPISLQRLLAGNSPEMLLDPNPAKQLLPPRLPPAMTLFNKTGSTGGFGSYVAFVPGKKIGVVMMANKNFPIANRIQAAYAILEQLAQIAQ